MSYTENYDWSQVEETQPLLPEGKYLCSVHDIVTTNDMGNLLTTQSGDEMWRLKLHVDQGTHQGAILNDNLVFSEKGVKRVKFVCSRLGLDMDTKFKLMPDMLIGKQAYVTVLEGEYNGNKKNEVPWNGYAKLGDNTQQPEQKAPSTPAPQSPDPDLPF